MNKELPEHDELGLATRAVEFVSIVASVALLFGQIGRLFGAAHHWSWWMVPLGLAGGIAADLVSGLVHWTADTWGQETLPVVGRRFLRPFRVHHVNPDDFLRRNFIDTNGDVAMIVIPVLLCAWWLPVTSTIGVGALVFVVAFCAVGLPTNQIHQWAHRSSPPRWVGWLQDRGIILSHSAHRQHHVAPYAVNYCIATGWCNRVLTRIEFYRHLERIVTWLSGFQPRRDEIAFQSEHCATRPNDTASSERVHERTN